MCKSWCAAEKANAEQPTELILRGTTWSNPYIAALSFLTWRLRSCEKLVKLVLACPTSMPRSQPWAPDTRGAKLQRCSSMLSQACALALRRAKALQALEISLTWVGSEAAIGGRSGQHLLMQLGELTGLTRLRLHSWTYSQQDVPSISCLSRLVLLQVNSLSLAAPAVVLICRAPIPQRDAEDSYSPLQIVVIQFIKTQPQGSHGPLGCQLLWIMPPLVML